MFKIELEPRSGKKKIIFVFYTNLMEDFMKFG